METLDQFQVDKVVLAHHFRQPFLMKRIMKQYVGTARGALHLKNAPEGTLPFMTIAWISQRAENECGAFRSS